MVEIAIVSAGRGLLDDLQGDGRLVVEQAAHRVLAGAELGSVMKFARLFIASGLLGLSGCGLRGRSGVHRDRLRLDGHAGAHAHEAGNDDTLVRR